MLENGFSSQKEREFFESIADKFIDRAFVAKAEGKRTKYQLTEMIIWNGLHQITMTRWEVAHCGGIKPFYERNNVDLSIRLRKMVTGK